MDDANDEVPLDTMVLLGPGKRVRLGDLTADQLVDLIAAQQDEEVREALRGLAVRLVGFANYEDMERGREP